MLCGGLDRVAHTYQRGKRWGKCYRVGPCCNGPTKNKSKEIVCVVGDTLGGLPYTDWLLLTALALLLLLQGSFVVGLTYADWLLSATNNSTRTSNSARALPA